MNSGANITLEKISAHIKKMRIEAGYTSYRKFANEHDFEPKQYWNIEEAQSNFGIKTLIKIVEIHSISMQEFFKGLEEANK